MKHDLYRVDNVLLKTGILAAAILIFVALSLRPWESRLPRSYQQGDYLVTQLDGRGRIIDERVHVHSSITTEQARMKNLEGRYPNALLIRRSPPPAFSFNLSVQEKYFLAAAFAPVVLIGVGLFSRKREKRILSVWRQLRNNVETDVAALLANSDFTRQELATTIKLLNNRGLAFYTWDSSTDTIADGRLASEYVHIDKCESCGASVGLKVKASLKQAPLCPYCHGGLSARGLNELKQDALRELRHGGSAGPAPVASRPMSIWLFVVLVLLCWPAAIAYAVYKSQSKRQLV